MYTDDDDKTVFMPLNEGEEIGVTPPGERDLQETHQEFVQENLFNKISGLNYVSGPNKLIKFSSELFAIHYQLIHKSMDCNADKLSVLINDALTKFTIRCQQEGISDRALKSGQYVLCTFIDEVILSTEYGQEIQWSQQSMLSSHFNESWGGETFYKIRLFCLDNLADFIEVFELVYICLCLGFKGQYANARNGELMFERLKKESYEVICQYRNIKDEESVSPNWKTDYEPKQFTKQKYSFWTFLFVTLFILVLMFSTLSYFSYENEKPVLQNIEQTKKVLVDNIIQNQKLSDSSSL